MGAAASSEWNCHRLGATRGTTQLKIASSVGQSQALHQRPCTQNHRRHLVVVASTLNQRPSGSLVQQNTELVLQRLQKADGLKAVLRLYHNSKGSAAAAFLNTAVLSALAREWPSDTLKATAADVEYAQAAFPGLMSELRPKFATLSFELLAQLLPSLVTLHRALRRPPDPALLEELRAATCAAARNSIRAPDMRMLAQAFLALHTLHRWPNRLVAPQQAAQVSQMQAARQYLSSQLVEGGQERLPGSDMACVASLLELVVWYDLAVPPAWVQAVQARVEELVQDSTRLQPEEARAAAAEQPGGEQEGGQRGRGAAQASSSGRGAGRSGGMGQGRDGRGRGRAGAASQANASDTQASKKGAPQPRQQHWHGPAPPLDVGSLARTTMWLCALPPASRPAGSWLVRQAMLVFCSQDMQVRAKHAQALAEAGQAKAAARRERPASPAEAAAEGQGAGWSVEQDAAARGRGARAVAAGRDGRHTDGPAGRGGRGRSRQPPEGDTAKPPTPLGAAPMPALLSGGVLVELAAALDFALGSSSGIIGPVETAAIEAVLLAGAGQLQQGQLIKALASLARLGHRPDAQHQTQWLETLLPHLRSLTQPEAFALLTALEASFARGLPKQPPPAEVLSRLLAAVRGWPGGLAAVRTPLLLALLDAHARAVQPLPQGFLNELGELVERRMLRTMAMSEDELLALTPRFQVIAQLANKGASRGPGSTAQPEPPRAAPSAAPVPQDDNALMRAAMLERVMLPLAGLRQAFEWPDTFYVAISDWQDGGFPGLTPDKATLLLNMAAYNPKWPHVPAMRRALEALMVAALSQAQAHHDPGALARLLAATGRTLQEMKTKVLRSPRQPGGLVEDTAPDVLPLLLPAAEHLLSLMQADLGSPDARQRGNRPEPSAADRSKAEQLASAMHALWVDMELPPDTALLERMLDLAQQGLNPPCRAQALVQMLATCVQCRFIPGGRWLCEHHKGLAVALSGTAEAPVQLLEGLLRHLAALEELAAQSRGGTKETAFIDCLSDPEAVQQPISHAFNLQKLAERREVLRAAGMQLLRQRALGELDGNPDRMAALARQLAQLGAPMGRQWARELASVSQSQIPGLSARGLAEMAEALALLRAAPPVVWLDILMCRCGALLDEKNQFDKYDLGLLLGAAHTLRRAAAAWLRNGAPESAQQPLSAQAQQAWAKAHSEFVAAAMAAMARYSPRQLQWVVTAVAAYELTRPPPAKRIAGGSSGGAAKLGLTPAAAAINNLLGRVEEDWVLSCARSLLQARTASAVVLLPSAELLIELLRLAAVVRAPGEAPDPNISSAGSTYAPLLRYVAVSLADLAKAHRQAVEDPGQADTRFEDDEGGSRRQHPATASSDGAGPAATQAKLIEQLPPEERMSATMWRQLLAAARAAGVTPRPPELAAYCQALASFLAAGEVPHDVAWAEAAAGLEAVLLPMLPWVPDAELAQRLAGALVLEWPDRLAAASLPQLAVASCYLHQAGLQEGAVWQALERELTRRLQNIGPPYVLEQQMAVAMLCYSLEHHDCSRAVRASAAPLLAHVNAESATPSPLLECRQLLSTLQLLWLAHYYNLPALAEAVLQPGHTRALGPASDVRALLPQQLSELLHVLWELAERQHLDGLDRAPSLGTSWSEQLLRRVATCVAAPGNGITGVDAALALSCTPADAKEPKVAGALAISAASALSSSELPVRLAAKAVWHLAALTGGDPSASEGGSGTVALVLERPVVTRLVRQLVEQGPGQLAAREMLQAAASVVMLTAPQQEALQDVEPLLAALMPHAAAELQAMRTQELLHAAVLQAAGRVLASAIDQPSYTSWLALNTPLPTLVGLMSAAAQAVSAAAMAVLAAVRSTQQQEVVAKPAATPLRPVLGSASPAKAARLSLQLPEVAALAGALTRRSQENCLPPALRAYLLRLLSFPGVELELPRSTVLSALRRLAPGAHEQPGAGAQASPHAKGQPSALASSSSISEGSALHGAPFSDAVAMALVARIQPVVSNMHISVLPALRAAGSSEEAQRHVLESVLEREVALATNMRELVELLRSVRACVGRGVAPPVSASAKQLDPMSRIVKAAIMAARQLGSGRRGQLAAVMDLVDEVQALLPSLPALCNDVAMYDTVMLMAWHLRETDLGQLAVGNTARSDGPSVGGAALNPAARRKGVAAAAHDTQLWGQKYSSAGLDPVAAAAEKALSFSGGPQVEHYALVWRMLGAMYTLGPQHANNTMWHALRMCAAGLRLERTEGTHRGAQMAIWPHHLASQISMTRGLVQRRGPYYVSAARLMEIVLVLSPEIIAHMRAIQFMPFWKKPGGAGVDEEAISKLRTTMKAVAAISSNRAEPFEVDLPPRRLSARQLGLLYGCLTLQAGKVEDSGETAVLRADVLAAVEPLYIHAVEELLQPLQHATPPGGAAASQPGGSSSWQKDLKLLEAVLEATEPVMVHELLVLSAEDEELGVPIGRWLATALAPCLAANEPLLPEGIFGGHNVALLPQPLTSEALLARLHLPKALRVLPLPADLDTDGRHAADAPATAAAREAYVRSVAPYYALVLRVLQASACRGVRHPLRSQLESLAPAPGCGHWAHALQLLTLHEDLMFAPEVHDLRLLRELSEELHRNRPRNAAKAGVVQGMAKAQGSSVQDASAAVAQGLLSALLQPLLTHMMDARDDDEDDGNGDEGEEGVGRENSDEEAEEAQDAEEGVEVGAQPRASGAAPPAAPAMPLAGAQSAMDVASAVTREFQAKLRALGFGGGSSEPLPGRSGSK